MLSVTPGQIKAATDAKTTKTEIIAPETTDGTYPLNEIKTIDLTSLNSSENKDVLKEASPLLNDQGRHRGRYHNRHNRGNVDVTIRSERSIRHNHNGAYIGGGGVLILILILVLVL